ncbi:FtsX-like permease family protein [Flavihumibacter profundi]|uniref:FtsX-like permease family protein n=1 Tax=Flavihumibacter profundi TaxID=2716883 RepID=UPI001CC55E81|nr:FtsX-like permease family protein [Flavihumibacter profundi]MBZ5858533.1 FtsX-like permease family protein [Flavihumibacter profundi]
MNFLFAWRYFKSKKSTNAINVIAWVSVSAVVVGTASLIVVLSVFNGFEDLVKSLYATFYTDIKVVPASGKLMHLSAEQLRAIGQVPGVKSFSLVMEEKALLQNGEAQTIVYLKGVDSAYGKVTTLPETLKAGKFELGDADKPFSVMGVGIENALGVLSEQNLLPLTVYLPKRDASLNVADPMQSLSAENMYTSGAFAIQQDFDNKYVITNLPFMRRMLNLAPDEYGGVEIAVADKNEEDRVQQQLSQLLGKQYRVQTRYEQNQGLYSIMQMEKWVIYGVLCLILVVAAFTMIGSLTMLVLEKQKDIQVLKAMGASNGRIQTIFISEGFLLAGLGALAGMVLALFICWAQVKYKLVTLEGGSFVIDYYPVKFHISDFLLVLATVVVVAFLAAWFPARKAALEPVELRSGN